MRAVILAAGEGTRLRPLTADRPKCLVEVAGRPMLEWQLDALRRAGVVDVAIVTGYRADAITQVARRYHNDRYADTNMVASLMCAREVFAGDDDVLVAYGDIVYDPSLVLACLKATAPVAVAVDRHWRELWEWRMENPLADAETLRIGADGNLVELGRRPERLDDIEGQYVGLIRVRADEAPDWPARFDALDPAGPYEGRDRDHMFLTAFVQLLVDDGVPVEPVLVDGGWLEVDTCDDLRVYEELHASGALGARIPLVAG
jgi:choline kinase